MTILLAVFSVPFLTGCGGKIAKTGYAAVTEVAPNGVMRLQYADGKGAWKRINRDNIEKDFMTVRKNEFKWGRYVETKQGSTLTFPGGDTVIYQNTDLN